MSRHADSPAQARDFVLFSAGQCVSSTGTWMQKTAFGWLTWELTHSPAWVGAMGLADLVALLWVVPFAGVATDRSNPLRLMAATQSALLLLSAVLCVVVWSGAISVWGLWLFALADSTLQGFNQPVRMTAINLLAGSERISQAVATSSIAQNVARSIGPTIAGVLIATVGPAAVFGIDALSFLAMLATIWWLRARLHRDPLIAKVPLRGAIVEGFRFILHDPRLLPLFLVVAGFALFARPFFDMLPAFAGGVFEGGPHTLASLLSAQGLGALVGGMWMLRRRHDSALTRIALVAAIGLCVVIFAFSFVGRLPLALVLMTLAGLVHVICNIALQSLVQLRAADQARGRILSLYSLLFRTGPSIGAVAIGFAAAHVGLGPVVAISAGTGFVIIVAAGARLRQRGPAA